MSSTSSPSITHVGLPACGEHEHVDTDAGSLPPCRSTRAWCLVSRFSRSRWIPQGRTDPRARKHAAGTGVEWGTTLMCPSVPTRRWSSNGSRMRPHTSRPDAESRHGQACSWRARHTSTGADSREWSPSPWPWLDCRPTATPGDRPLVRTAGCRGLRHPRIPVLQPVRALYDEVRRLDDGREGVVAVDMAAAAGVTSSLGWPTTTRRTRRGAVRAVSLPSSVTGPDMRSLPSVVARLDRFEQVAAAAWDLRGARLRPWCADRRQCGPAAVSGALTSGSSSQPSDPSTWSSSARCQATHSRIWSPRRVRSSGSRGSRRATSSAGRSSR